MIALLNRNELSYERKSLFRKNFHFGTCQVDNPSTLLDKGKLLTKLEKTGGFEREWVLYLYKKLNALNQQYKEKFKWSYHINRHLGKNYQKFMQQREKILARYGYEGKKTRSATDAKVIEWKGIDTTATNYIRFRFLKQQLKQSDHPITQLIDQFEKWTSKAYNFLRFPTQEELNMEHLRDEIIENTQQFIVLMFFTTIKFYCLSFKDNENNRDILLEIITGMVVKKNLHLAIYNAITYCKAEEIDTLEKKMSKEENVDFDKSEYIAGVSDIFSFSESKRRNKILRSKSEVPDIFNQETDAQFLDEKPNTKYQKCSQMISKLKDVENPTSKIQLLVKVTNQIKQEIDDYWKGVPISQDDKRIDADNMERLMGYIIVKSKYQKIGVDLAIIEYFSGNHIDFGCNGFIYVCISNSLQQIVNDSCSSSDEEIERKTPAFKATRRSKSQFHKVVKEQDLWDKPGLYSSSEKKSNSNEKDGSTPIPFSTEDI